MATATATLTTLNDLVNTETISRLVLLAAQEQSFMHMLCYNEDVEGTGSLTANFARYAALTAAGVNENADVSASAFSTDQAGTITASEVFINVALSDKSRKTTNRISMDAVAAACGRALADKMQTDGCSIFSSISATVGSTGVNLALTDIDEAIYTLANAKAPIGNDSLGNLPPALLGTQCVLHTRQAADLRTALRQANMAFVGAQEMGLLLQSGRVPVGAIGSYLEVSFWQSTKPPTANSAADRVGAMFVPAAFGFVTCGAPSVEYDRDASARSTEAVVGQTYAFGIIANDYACGIVTDA